MYQYIICKPLMCTYQRPQHTHGREHGMCIFMYIVCFLNDSDANFKIISYSPYTWKVGVRSCRI